jgi:gamma-glutamyltranspeptidase / glutathione hydrolase
MPGTLSKFCLALAAAAAPVVRAAPAQGHSSHGAVASEAKPCTEAGIEMLRRGGSAADAHVATTFCVGVIGMYHSGIGGGGFMLIHAPNGEYEFVDFREKAPAASTRNMYKDNVDASIYGGLAR